MSITVQTATQAFLDEVVDAVALWQQDGVPVQLHPGDLGWHWRLGAEELAQNVRVWRRDGRIAAVGVVDDSRLIRMAIAPSAEKDDLLAARLMADISDPAGAVLPAGTALVEARFGTALRELLHDSGWVPDEPWTPLCRDLTGQVEDCALRVAIVKPRDARDRVAVQRAAFANSTFTLERWLTMISAPPYRRARCLVAYDAHDEAVAAVTVWSAGQGRPGLLEPMGVHRDHRGHGYGTAISIAAAAALREMGSSSAMVCTPSANAGAVATYASAGFQRLPDVTDFRRTG
ncbi:MAG TPA: GNAT family N-acetyltransferase [Jatrophihabitans sp.]|jgi:GNAT superfamily N-acetyltransferase|uniref:GNAT family N-acetyltransferase n=1 Tax=Jatrophihabitans sp. TaxID=1932789 RepID=UPI002EF5B44C